MIGSEDAKHSVRKNALLVLARTSVAAQPQYLIAKSNPCLVRLVTARAGAPQLQWLLLGLQLANVHPKGLVCPHAPPKTNTKKQDTG